MPRGKGGLCSRCKMHDRHKRSTYCAECQRRLHKEYYEENRERCLSKSKAYYDRNAEAIKEHNRMRYKLLKEDGLI